jgi:hypothetical protein
LARVATVIDFIATFIDHWNASPANVVESLFLRQWTIVEAQVPSTKSALHGFRFLQGFELITSETFVKRFFLAL